MRLARACFSSLSRSLWNISLYFIMMYITKWHHWSLKWFSTMSFGDQYNAKQLYYRVHLDFVAENNAIVTHPLLAKSQHIPHAGDMIQLLCSLTGLSYNHLFSEFQSLFYIHMFIKACLWKCKCFDDIKFKLICILKSTRLTFTEKYLTKYFKSSQDMSWAPCSGCLCLSRGCTRWPPEVPSNLNHSVIL